MGEVELAAMPGVMERLIMTSFLQLVQKLDPQGESSPVGNLQDQYVISCWNSTKPHLLHSTPFFVGAWNLVRLY